MTAPLRSGRSWQPDPAGQSAIEETGISGATFVQDANELTVRGVLKAPAGEVPAYALGMERVAYVLGTSLGLPVPTTHLDDFNSVPVSVQIRVPARSWKTAQGAPMMISNITNKDVWALAGVFDIWLANTDRRAANFLLEPLPEGRDPGKATGSRFWLIDHGQCGLFPGWTLDRRPDHMSIPDVAADAASGLCHADVEAHIKSMMFTELKREISRGGADVRSALDLVQQVDDPRIESAINEIPSEYFTVEQAETLSTFLKARRSLVDRVVRTYW